MSKIVNKIVSSTNIEDYHKGHLERLDLDDLDLLLSVEQTKTSLKRLGEARFSFPKSVLNLSTARLLEKLKTSVLNERSHEVIARMASMPRNN